MAVADESHGFKNHAAPPNTQGRWIRASTSPLRECSPSRSVRTSSPTTSPTPRRQATSRIRRLSRASASLLLQNTATGQTIGPLNTGVRIDADHHRTSTRRRCARPVSRSTSGSPATASSASARPPASATRVTVSSRLDGQGLLVDGQGNQVLGPGRRADPRQRQGHRSGVGARRLQRHRRPQAGLQPLHRRRRRHGRPASSARASSRSRASTRSTR